MLSPVKRRLFYLIALLLPLLILLLAELSLRAAGYGSSYPLFVPSPLSTDYLEPNPAVMQRYFAPAQAPGLSMDTQLIRREKAPHSLRIVIQGGSTAAGFPYGRWGSLQAMLTQQLKQQLPERDIEVINTAMAAVNSYSLLDFQPDILALKPDLVVIYAGHNEFLGVLGAGSVLSPAGGRTSTLLLLKVKQLRIFQLLRNLLAGNAEPAATDQRRSLMAEIARGADIATNSPLYRDTLTQFQANMALLLQGYQQQGIPVLLGNLVSNERDLVPFSAVALAEWSSLLPALQQGIDKVPEQLLANPVAADFVRGQQALAAGKVEEATQLLQHARDNDSLRFRAPTQFNQVLAQLAAKHQATLVDIEALFRRHSKDGLIGNNLLLEHVHPNVAGYKLMAAGFYQALRQSPLLQQAGTAAKVPVRAEDAPLTELDIRYAGHKIDNLLRQYPFNQTNLPPLPALSDARLDQLLQQRLNGAPWLPLQYELVRYYRQQQDLPATSKALAMLADALPHETELWHEAGLAYLQHHELSLASYYLHRAWQQQPDNQRYLLNLAHLRFLQKNYAASLQLLQQAQQLAPQDKRTQGFIDKVRQVLADAG
ncbi:GDSL-type esterase/lipase family protein [Rheinheimera gaetbuli]